MTRYLAPAVAALAVAFSGAAQAAESVKINLTGVDLTTDAGARIAQKRISQAVDLVCGDIAGLRPIELRRSVMACRSEVTSQAVAAVGAPQLARLYRDVPPAVLAAR